MSDTVTKRHLRRECALRAYSYNWNMARRSDLSADERARHQTECDRLTAEAKRVERIAKIMRDPFFLAAERAAG
jgi:hypothetical protein